MLAQVQRVLRLVERFTGQVTFLIPNTFFVLSKEALTSKPLDPGLAAFLKAQAVKVGYKAEFVEDFFAPLRLRKRARFKPSRLTRRKAAQVGLAAQPGDRQERAGLGRAQDPGQSGLFGRTGFGRESPRVRNPENVLFAVRAAVRQHLPIEGLQPGLPVPGLCAAGAQNAAELWEAQLRRGQAARKVPAHQAAGHWKPQPGVRPAAPPRAELRAPGAGVGGVCRRRAKRVPGARARARANGAGEEQAFAEGARVGERARSA